MNILGRHPYVHPFGTAWVCTISISGITGFHNLG